MRLSALADAKCNEFDLALDKAKRLFRVDPSDTWLLSEIARTALSQRRDDIAEQLIAIAKTANMEDTAIHIVSGTMLLRRGDLPGAEEHFEKACKLTRRTAWPYYYLGKTRLRKGEVDEAVDALCDGEEFIYDKSIRNVKVLTAIRTQLGIAYLLLDRIDLAKPILEGLFTDETSDPEVMRAYAFLCLKADGIETAHEAYKRLSDAKIRSRHDRAQYHLFYGLFYLGLEDKGNASREFSKAHREDKNNVYVMVKLARVYYDMAMDSWIDDDLGIAETYANDCGVVVKEILEFDFDNDVAKHLQIELYERFDIELSKL